jgi:N-acetyl-gamma-glutamyl-phosphate reductase
MDHNTKINVGIFGASGYTGFEAVRLVKGHPAMRLCFATSESAAGKTLSDIYPVSWATPLISAAEASLSEVEAVFCCLPHAASMPTVIAAREAGVRVIDLSADFRLTDVEVYRKWYQVPHQAPELLAEAVYGLTELNRTQISETDLLANPGCYPTSILLAVAPLLESDLLDPAAPMIADSKSGVSGAGRKPSLKTHFVEANENISPYNLGQSHRHVAEMVQVIELLGGDGGNLIFSPHLVPVSRGMLATVYVSLAKDVSSTTLHELFLDYYDDKPLVRVLPSGQVATMAHTQRTNLCVISVTPVNARQLILCASLDNLGKGAAGQAVQNFNIMFGLEEVAGLV